MEIQIWQSGRLYNGPIFTTALQTRGYAHIISRRRGTSRWVLLLWLCRCYRVPREKHAKSSSGSFSAPAVCVWVCGYRRSGFPAETTPRTERRAAPHHRLCVNHPHTVSDTTQHQPSQHPHLTAKRTRSKHIFIQASIPQLPAVVCAPPTAGACLCAAWYTNIYF